VELPGETATVIDGLLLLPQPENTIPIARIIANAARTFILEF
jgi:hypothetical protein